MRIDQLKHVVGAAANVVEEDEFVVIGSQAILGTHPEAPETLLRSMEADLYPRRTPAKADKIDGALGDGSQFHRSFGYYAHGVGPEAAKAPAGWEARLVVLAVESRPGSIRKPVAYCLEIHDLVLAKCAAGRDHDWRFALEVLKSGLVEAGTLLSRIDAMPIDGVAKEHIRAMVEGFAARSR